MRLLLSVCLVGCGNEALLRSRADTQVVPPDDPTSPSTTPTREPRSCSDAVEEVIEVVFPARSDCAFAQGPNLERRNEFLQAYAEDAEFVALPDGSRLCGLTLASQGERTSFDDHLAIAVDDVVVVSGGSGGALDDYPIVAGLPRFDWPAIRGRPFADRYTPYECLGEGSCVVPRTEEYGPLDVQIDPATMASLVDALSIHDGFDVRILVFGDDDPDDCAHRELALDLQVRYVP